MLPCRPGTLGFGFGLGLGLGFGFRADRARTHSSVPPPPPPLPPPSPPPSVIAGHGLLVGIQLLLCRHGPPAIHAAAACPHSSQRPSRSRRPWLEAGRPPRTAAFWAPDHSYGWPRRAAPEASLRGAAKHAFTALPLTLHSTGTSSTWITSGRDRGRAPAPPRRRPYNRAPRRAPSCTRRCALPRLDVPCTWPSPGPSMGRGCMHMEIPWRSHDASTDLSSSPRHHSVVRLSGISVPARE